MCVCVFVQMLIASNGTYSLALIFYEDIREAKGTSKLIVPVLAATTPQLGFLDFDIIWVQG